MNILFVHQNFPGQFKSLAPALVREGHKVTALTLRDIKPQIWNGVRIIPYKLKKLPSGDAHPWACEMELKIIRGAACLEAAVALAKEGFNPDLILAHPGWGESLFLKDLWPEKVLAIYCEYFYSNTMQDMEFDPEFPPKPIELTASEQVGVGPVRLKNFINYMHIPIADAGLSPTQWQANTFPEDFRKKITVIHDGIDTNILAPDTNAILTLNDTLKLGKNDEILTFVNRELEPFRGYHVFMRSLPEIMRRRPKLRVLIVGGDGVSYGSKHPNINYSWRDIFATEVRLKMTEEEWNRIHFVGKIPYSHFITLLQISTIHVYLSYPFVLSWSMLEAMSVGCAVVASDTNPVKEMIEHNKTGRLVSFFDIKELSDTVLSLLDQPLERDRIGQNARNFIKNELDLREKCLPQQMQWIESLCHSNNP